MRISRTATGSRVDFVGLGHRGRVSFFLAGFAVCLAAWSDARAAVLADDKFTLSSGSNVGTVNNTESAGVGTYSTIQGSLGMTVTTLSGFGNGNVLRLANGSQTYYRGFDGGASLTLGSMGANTGLRLSFDVRFDGTFAGADNFSFGFVNLTTPDSVLYANIDLSPIGGVVSEFRYRDGSFNMSDNINGIVIGSAFTEPATVDDANYRLTLDVFKQTSGGYQISYYRGSTLVASTTQGPSSGFATTMGSTPITGIAFRHSNTPGVLTYLDNVNVSQIIPEPSTGVVMLSAFVLLWAARGRLVTGGRK